MCGVAKRTTCAEQVWVSVLEEKVSNVKLFSQTLSQMRGTGVCLLSE